jgi:peroxiredoxin
MLRHLLSSAVVCTWLATVAWGDDASPTANTATTAAVKQGHSLHGEVFNEGPRQRAYLMPGMPQVQFAVTAANPEAAKFFQQGVGQLHGFWYFEAERSFRQAAALDPDCAMAYWGMTMANLENEQRAKKFIVEAVKRKEKASERERLYIDALENYLKDGKKKERSQALAKAYERILYRYPDDVEAKALLVLQLWKNESQGVKIESFLAYDALLDQIFAVAPNHPAHHFRIHLWDRERPEKALTSAAQCGQSSPGIAHMWHMPGHTYSNLKRYADAVWQQEASARVDHAYMIRDRVMPDQIHNYAHNNEWTIRNLVHVGRAHDAVALAKNMCELPRHPSYNTFSKKGSAAYGRERLIGTLVQYELWNDLLALAGSPYLEPTDVEAEQLRRLRALGAAYYSTGKTSEGDNLRVHVERNLDSLRWQQELAENQAKEKAASEKKDEKQAAKAGEQARQAFNSRVNDWQKAADELAGHALVARGSYKEGRELLKKAGVDGGYLAWLQVLSGDNDGAIKAAQDFVNANTNEVLPLAWQVEVLWKAGKRDDAKAAFERLRALSTFIDLDVPRFQRLTTIAKQLQLPDDWRIIKPPANDVGNRPDLATLGPLYWHPSAAPAFSLAAADGQVRSLGEYRGRPVVLIFFLGHGCLHCAQQLHAFGPLKERFAAAGFDLLAISSDDQEGLRKSIEDYDGPLPVSLVSDATLATFKAYRCFDDFEQQPLHGTFVIDKEGQVRWQDIGAEPFMDAAFVLTEAQRLIALPAPTGSFPQPVPVNGPGE